MEGGGEDGKKCADKAREVCHELTVQVNVSIHRTYMDLIVLHARKYGGNNMPVHKRRRKSTFTPPKVLILHITNLSRPQSGKFCSFRCFQFPGYGGDRVRIGLSGGGHHQTEEYFRPKTRGSNVRGRATSQRQKESSFNCTSFPRYTTIFAFNFPPSVTLEHKLCTFQK